MKYILLFIEKTELLKIVISGLFTSILTLFLILLTYFVKKHQEFYKTNRLLYTAFPDPQYRTIRDLPININPPFWLKQEANIIRNTAVLGYKGLKPKGCNHESCTDCKEKKTNRRKCFRDQHLEYILKI